MRKLYRSAEREVRPDVVTYGSLIQVLIKSDDPSAAGRQADKYLQEMKNENIEPNAIVYTSMIKAWSKRTDPKAKERIKALKSEMKRLNKWRR
jgi:pentatricopeptide repeat protein